MALVVDKADLLVEEILKGLRTSSTTQYLALLGASTLAYIGGKFAIQLLDGIRIHVLSRLCTANLKEKYGNWAIVTGCTNGIGRALTIELASKGLNIVLVARNAAYLEELSQHLESNYKIETLVIVADFKGTQIYDNIKDKLKPIEKDLGMLFNNVGMAGDELKYYANCSDSLVVDMINTNITSVALMTKIVLELMEKRGRGAIVNVSSVAGLYPIPLMSLYSATKAFVNHFSLNMQHEYGSKGIVVQNLTPMGVRTKMLKDIAKGDKDMVDNCMTPSAEVYAQSVLRVLGKTPQTTGYWRHSLLNWIVGCFPTSFIGQRSHHMMRSRLNAQDIKLD